MEINDTIIDGLVVITLQGSFLGGKDSVNFAETISRCIEEGNTNILLDLGRLDYMNSIGLGSVVNGYLKLKKSNGQLVIANAKTRVLELLRLTKTDTVIPLCESIEAAKEMLA